MFAFLTDRQWMWCAAGFYLAGALLGSLSLLRRGRPLGGVMYGLIAIGYVLQLAGLSERGRVDGECPLGNTFEMLQFIAWSAITLYLLIGVTFRSSFLGYFTASLTAALTLLSLAVSAWDPPRPTRLFGGNPWIEFHAALAVFSYGVFALLALTSLLFLLRHYSLKSKRLGGRFTFLPSIFELDLIGVRLLAVGVALLGGSLVVGSVYWLRDARDLTPANHLVTAALWIAYAVALGLRLRGRLLAKRFAWTCLALFAAALVSLGAVEGRRHPAPAPSAAARPAPARPIAAPGVVPS